MHPVLFHVYSYPVYTYGVFVALGVFLALVLARRRAGRYGLDAHTAVDFALLLFISGVIGARLFYVVQHADDYSGQWTRIFSLREGGLVWYGGFLAALAAGASYATRKKIPLLRAADFFSPILALSHAVGRVGCFLNGCCYGRFLASGERVAIQLFEAGGLVVLALFLFRLERRPFSQGSIFSSYLIGYGAWRFFLEFWRGDQDSLAGLTPPQWMSLVVFGSGLFLLIKIRSFSRHGKS